MPATSKKQQRLFGMIHALQKGTLSKRKVSSKIRNLAKRIDAESVSHFAKTKHEGLPEKKEAEFLEDFEARLMEHLARH